MKAVTTILFVENDAVALTMYQKRLQREGFHVETAEDGIAALRVLSEVTPDLVILDLMLPKFSGKDVFDYMRADAKFKQVPVIIFSNAPRTEWPQNIESSPTRALPKSEANFSALMEMVRELTTAAAATAQAPAPAAPAPEPPVVVEQPEMAPASAAPSAADDIDAVETVEGYLQYAMADLPVLREHSLAFIKSPTTDAGRTHLITLRKRLQALDAGAQKARCARLALLAGAWEALLAEIERKPAAATPSILQTLAQAADCLRILLNDGVRSMEPVPKARVLSVDDDEICNHVAVSALQRGNMDADSVQDATAALELVKENNYDLVLLDINMPGLTGFELCEKLRALPNHARTPVIFVTAYNNFENRKQSVLSGGGDLIAKPVSPLELALKVTIHLLKAPAKTVVNAPATTSTEAEPALVWKEPVETISHDTELRRSLAAHGSGKNGKPNVVVPTTETRTGEAEPEDLEASVARELKPAKKTVPEPVLASASASPISAGPLAGLKMKAAEPKPVAAKPAPVAAVAPSVTPAPVATPAPAAPVVPTPVKPAPVEPKPVLESAPRSRALPDEGKVVPTQPPQSSKPTAPISNGSSKPSQPMNKENSQDFDTLVLDVAHIIFGDNAPDINVRLVRMALEQVWQHRAELQTVDSIAREIARIIFGDANASDLNVRLVRMALERSNSIQLFKAAAA